MQPTEPQPGAPIGPFDLLKIIPVEPCRSSDRLEWVGLEAAHYRAQPAFELHPPALTTTCSFFINGRRRNWI
jgi:hypothetical protein